MQTITANATAAFDDAARAAVPMPGFVQGHALHNLRQLVVMRNVAIVAQTITVLVVQRGLDIDLPLAWLGAIIATLALVNLATWRRLSRPRPVTDAELMCQLLIDVAALTLLLAMTGGATNPFVGIFVLPLTITAACLPWGYTWVIALATVACYSLLALLYRPLVGAGDDARFVQLIVAGMWANYAITAGMIAHFVARLATNLRRHQEASAVVRERELEAEHLMRIGTLAAGAAHELAQPLSTMAVIVGELEQRAREQRDLLPVARAMSQQLRNCQDTLGALLSYGRQTIDTGHEVEGFDSFVQRCVEAFQARRPRARTRVAVDAGGPAPLVRHDLALRQAIVNLLCNAADASDATIEVTLGWDQSSLHLSIRDRGPGLAPEAQERIGRLFFTTKPRGMGNGLGLCLAQTAIARLGGSLQLVNADGGGAIARLVLPVARLAADPAGARRSA